MDDQLGLFGVEHAIQMFVPKALTSGCRPTSYSLFFAVRPALEDVLRCGQYVDTLCHGHGSAAAKSMSAERLHVSLIEVAAFERELPQLVLDAARAAAEQLRSHGALMLNFDRLESFTTNSACVLSCSADSSRQVLALRDQLAMWVKRRGLKLASTSTPHMTAYYDQARRAAMYTVETLTWSARSLSLLLSHKGCTEHQLIAEWSLE